MRCAVLVSLLACLHASAGASRLALVPIDSRPPTAQMPVLLADIAGAEVAVPPLDTLGQFTTPGNVDKVSSWLLKECDRGVDAVVASADMLAYGGLIASREPNVSKEEAIRRLEVLRTLRKAHPGLAVYVYSALMRTAPTATDRNEPWRMDLARLVELQEKYRRTGAQPSREYQELSERISQRRLEWYWSARKRNLEVHKALIRMVKEGVITYLVIGADDSRPYGPQYPETKELRKLADDLGISGRVYFCEGVDQTANILVSRALLRIHKFSPIVRVLLADEAAGSRPMSYESKPLNEAIRDQILASGAWLPDKNETGDYVLFVNTENSSNRAVTELLDAIVAVQDGRPYAAVADINFDSLGSPDERFSRALLDSGLLPDLLSYASWNTASNTLGTAVAQANLYLLALKNQVPALRRERAHLTFLLHRVVSDYGYHSYLRPRANKALAEHPQATPREAHGYMFNVLQEWVERNASGLLEAYFAQYIKGRLIQDGDTAYEVVGIDGVKIWLPWPRAFEAWFEFELVCQPKGGS
jgi:hypothetical protein